MPDQVKSYKPFKMWGSYVGAAFGFFTAVSQPINPVLRNIFLFNYVFLVFLSTAFWFLIGWGIHSFFRKIRK